MLRQSRRLGISSRVSILMEWTLIFWWKKPTGSIPDTAAADAATTGKIHPESKESWSKGFVILHGIINVLRGFPAGYSGLWCGLLKATLATTYINTIKLETLTWHRICIDHWTPWTFSGTGRWRTFSARPQDWRSRVHSKTGDLWRNRWKRRSSWCRWCRTSLETADGIVAWNWKGDPEIGLEEKSECAIIDPILKSNHQWWALSFMLEQLWTRIFFPPLLHKTYVSLTCRHISDNLSRSLTVP